MPKKNIPLAAERRSWGKHKSVQVIVYPDYAEIMFESMISKLDHDGPGKLKPRMYAQKKGSGVLGSVYLSHQAVQALIICLAECANQINHDMNGETTNAGG